MATLIFDFDGTIADTLAAIVRITNRLAPDYGFPPTTPERLEYLRTLTPQQLLEQSDIPLFRIPFLIRRVRRELRQEIAQMSPIEGLPEVLRQLTQVHSLLIVSSNAPRNIQQFLALHGLTDMFDAIYANVGLLGKARRLRRIISRHHLNTGNTLYVGDETRDVAAAQQIDLPVAAVCWGFSSVDALLVQAPTFLVSDPAQLPHIADQLDAWQASGTIARHPPSHSSEPHSPASKPDDQTRPQSSAPLSAD